MIAVEGARDAVGRVSSDARFQSTESRESWDPGRLVFGWVRLTATVTATMAAGDSHWHTSAGGYLGGCYVCRGVRIPCRRQAGRSILPGGSVQDQ